jgi:hypothetical protein
MLATYFPNGTVPVSDFLRCVFVSEERRGGRGGEEEEEEEEEVEEREQ